MPDVVPPEPDPMEKAAEALRKLYAKITGHTATPVEVEAFEALRDLHDEVVRINSRIRHAKDKLTGAASWLDGEWG